MPFVPDLPQCYHDRLGMMLGGILEGRGRMLDASAILYYYVDMLNHDSETSNVSWKWHVGLGDEDKIREGKDDVAVTMICNKSIKK